MNIVTSCEPSLEPGVRDFLRKHQGEAACQKACELARACFPELTSLRARLLEDPDEDNHTWVVLDVLMPASHRPESLRAQEMRYYEELARQLPLPYHPFSFSLFADIIRD